MAMRRGFLACAICSAAGLVATAVAGPALAQGQGQAQPGAAPPAGGISRKTLSTIDYPGDGKISILVLLEAPAGAVIPRHTHPGIESSVVMSGELELEMQGQPTKRFAAGEGFQVPPGLPHSGRTLSAVRLGITYVVEKDKPLSSPA
ncbi:cupin domain-containing protein [Roseicella sp. DB1501]|uniref:cupin domain-containing protein n=1 Tax=Roseicella sp. DB1501 TaxID=2730925 RepID=UPI0014929E33|nr:cupin domain-containing protein [Roseicella sp. DB1501]NOG71663.1 cupin domain-containing protein [Roseicella sp. DB1501]